jgi:hypothetical protein
MISDTEAYRILGLARGASTDEVKRAYRRLAKIHHPDAAGEKNLPRFLAIQAAYEQLTDGLEGPARVRRPSSAPRRPWDADPDRTDATRRAYGGRARTSSSRPGSGGAKETGAGGTKQTGATGGAGGAASAPSSGSGQASGPRRPTGPADARSRTSSRRPGEPGGPSTRDGRRRPEAGPAAPGPGATASGPGSAGAPGAPGTEPKGRKRSKATLGSTSYDGVDGPFEPDWRGASWYGTTSGTYWTLNPKEYADPRKHGPEYQARARRATRARPPEAPGAPEAVPPDTETDVQFDASEAPEPATGPAAGPTHTTSSWWDSTTGAVGPDPEPDPKGAARRPAAPRPPDPPPPDLGRAMADIGRALTDDGFGGIRGRIVRGIIGWLPIAFGIGWLAGEMTGCGRFAATCDSTADPFVLLLQAAVLAVLLLVPALASVAAMGSIALLSAAVVTALVLSATGGAADGESRRSALGAALLVAWLIGIAIAVIRRVRALQSRTTPVS